MGRVVTGSPFQFSHQKAFLGRIQATVGGSLSRPFIAVARGHSRY